MVSTNRASRHKAISWSQPLQKRLRKLAQKYRNAESRSSDISPSTPVQKKNLMLAVLKEANIRGVITIAYRGDTPYSTDIAKDDTC